MSWEAWLTLAVVVIAIAAMARDLVPPAVAILGSTIILMLTTVITPEEAFSGFSNTATLTIAVLYVLAGAASRAGALQPLVSGALNPAASDRRNLARLLPSVTAASSVLNNTPIVAVLVPEITAWAGRHGRSVSTYLMPISFAAILGGTITLIGTAGNLVVSGLLEASGEDPLGFFEITVIGLPLAVVGLVILIPIAPRVLQDRRTTEDELTRLVRDFVVDMVVEDGGPLDGVTVERGGLRNLAGVFLVQIERNSETVAPVRPSTVLHGADRLRFVGKADDIVDLLAIPGLASGEQEQVAGFDLQRASFFEAVIGAASPMVGMTLKQSRFRSRYQAAVVAIHRAGHRVDAKLGEVPLRVGDTLVILGDVAFRERWRDRRDFLLISPLSEAPAPASHQRSVVLAIIALVIGLAALTPVPILNAALMGALAILALRIMTPGQAVASVDLSVILLIAGGFGLGAAMIESGLAESAAEALVDVLGGLGSIGVLAAIVIATVLLTEAISNTAAAFIVFPIAAATAQTLSLDIRGLAVAIAVAASASFLTPVGYQTNVMVYGPGGYRYRDYTRLGYPLTATVIIAILVGVPLVWPL